MSQSPIRADGPSRAGSPEAVLAFTLVGYPVVAAFSQLTGAPNRGLSIAARGVVVALAIDVILRRFLVRGRVPFTPFWALWSGFWVLCVSRILLDGVMNPRVLRLSVGEYMLWFIGTGLLPAIAQVGDHTDRAMRRALLATIALGTLAIVANLWVVRLSGSVFTLLALVSSRVMTETLNSISLGHLGATVLILALWLLITDRGPGVVRAITVMVAGALGLVALVLAGSRGPFVAVAAASPLLGLEFLRSRSPRIGYVLKLALPAAVVLCGVAWSWSHRDLWFGFHRISSDLFHDNARRELLIEALDTIRNNPITGAGTEPLGIYPHNVYVEAFLPFGVLSGVLFLAIVCLGVRAALLVFFRRPAQAWTSLMFFQALITGAFSGSMYLHSPLWVLLALVVSQASTVGHSPPVATARFGRLQTVTG